MTISRGSSKIVAAKKETTWGVLAGATGGKQFRRVTSDFNEIRESYESAEIRTDRQVADSRHGIRSAEGALNGELSPGSYSEFLASLIARDFTAAPSATGLTVTIAASGSFYTVARAAGSWLTDGFRVGQVVRLSGGTLDVANTAKNLLIVSETALILTVSVLDGSTLVAQAGIASVTATAPGKYTYAPLSNHTDQSYTVEEWFSDIGQSEVYTGCKVGTANIQLPSTGLTTIDLSFMGRGQTLTGTTQYFTNPTAQNTNGIFAAVNGAVIVNGQAVGIITSADFSIERGMENATGIGSNFVQDILTGRIRATGNLSVYFENGTVRDYFKNENKVSVVFALTSSTAKDSDFMTFTLPSVLPNSFSKQETETSVIASVAFQALLNSVTTAGLPDTTVAIQDSQA